LQFSLVKCSFSQLLTLHLCSVKPQSVSDQRRLRVADEDARKFLSTLLRTPLPLLPRLGSGMIVVWFEAQNCCCCRFTWVLPMLLLACPIATY